MSDLHNINYLYCLKLIKKHLSNDQAKILDYGCGKGEVVELCLQNKIDAYGVEEFYEGGNTLYDIKKKGLFNKAIYELHYGKIPFPEKTFDVIISNQVFEHIDDFTTPLQEIQRVLKDDGVFICIFPAKDCWKEGHIGIPFTHWFKRDSKLRFYWVLFFRYLGKGNFKNNKTHEEWTKDFLKWLDSFTYYKNIIFIRNEFIKYFYLEELKSDWIEYRIKKHRYISKISGLLLLFPKILAFFQRKLASRVFYLRKKNE